MGRGNINVTKYARAARGRGNTMKNTRKLLALLLALILTLGCLTAWGGFNLEREHTGRWNSVPVLSC